MMSKILTHVHLRKLRTVGLPTADSAPSELRLGERRGCGVRRERPRLQLHLQAQLKQKEKSDRMERARRIEEDAFIRYNLLMKERSAELGLLIPEDSVVVLTNTRRTLCISLAGSNILEPAEQF
ncbi:hypothetical protein BLNAU_20504 [Blattamonas nauphoetae]|uniref:Uncharacterized protein n=1 Tax=Blattamonas nauphoetae TaxID=2049346 RepID=A0ABQ9WYK8_9EUKA|nr:hypothetical protein BLNAU_20504 [Blattamonas nauphoetae]